MGTLEEKSGLFGPRDDRYYVTKKQGGKTMFFYMDMKKGPSWTDNHNFAYEYDDKDEAEDVAREVGGTAQLGANEASKTPGGSTDKVKNSSEYSGKSKRKTVNSDGGMLPEEEDEEEDEDDDDEDDEEDDDDNDEGEMNEAKMKDSEVLAAAKKLAKNGKDKKTKDFGAGLVKYYEENDSFTPDQVSGLQNIMKNASFQLAKEESDELSDLLDLLDESRIPQTWRKDKDWHKNFVRQMEKAFPSREKGDDIVMPWQGEITNNLQRIEDMYKKGKTPEQVARAIQGYNEETDLLSNLQNRLAEMNEEELQELSNLINDPIESSAAAVSQKVNTLVSANEETEEEEKTDISSLIESDETLSEEFKTKATTIFEAAVSEKVEKELASIREQFNERTRDAISEQYEMMVEKVDNYLTYAVETWVEENDESISNKLRTQISESFIESLKSVFEKHYIEMPEGKVDIYEDISEKASELEELAEKQSEQLDELNKTVEDLQREKVIREESEGLYDTEAERLQKLVRNLEFESVDNFKEKVSLIRETYFGLDNGKTENENNNKQGEKRLSEHTQTHVQEIEDENEIDENSEMGIYINALSRHVKNQI